MSRPLTAQARYAIARLEDFCLEAQAWTNGKTLAQAWRTCPCGQWVAYWLYMHARNRDTWQGISTIKRRVAPDEHMFLGCSFTEQSKAYADALRARYTPTGKLRQAVRE